MNEIVLVNEECEIGGVEEEYVEKVDLLWIKEDEALLHILVHISICFKWLFMNIIYE